MTQPVGQKRSIDGATVAFIAAGLLLLAPFVLYPAGVIRYSDLPIGFFVFFSWTALCIGAVIRRNMLAWLALCVLPLAVLSLDWIGPTLPKDDFGFFPWGSIALFSGVAIVTAATGILSIVRTATGAESNRS